jgi:hypothetical protein
MVSTKLARTAATDGDGLTGAAALNDGDAAAQSAARSARTSAHAATAAAAAPAAPVAAAAPAAAPAEPARRGAVDLTA